MVTGHRMDIACPWLEGHIYACGKCHTRLGNGISRMPLSSLGAGTKMAGRLRKANSSEKKWKISNFRLISSSGNAPETNAANSVLHSPHFPGKRTEMFTRAESLAGERVCVWLGMDTLRSLGPTEARPEAEGHWSVDLGHSLDLVICLHRLWLMGNMDKSLHEPLFAICSCIRQAGLFTHQVCKRHLVPKFINQHGDPFPEDGGAAGELQTPLSEVYVCLAMMGSMNSTVFLLFLHHTECWAIRIFRSSLWEILRAKGNVKSRVRLKVPRRGETAAASKEVWCSQWSRTGVLKDVTFLAHTELCWESGLAKARSSGVSQRTKGLRSWDWNYFNPSKTRLELFSQLSHRPTGCPAQGEVYGLWDPSQETCDGLTKMEGKNWRFFQRRRRPFHMKHHRWVLRAAHDLLFPHCVSGGLSAHPHTVFLSCNKQTPQNIRASPTYSYSADSFLTSVFGTVHILQLLQPSSWSQVW